MKYSIAFAIKFLFLFTFVNGQQPQLEFSFTNVVPPGSRPDPIPDTDSGNIGKYFYTKEGASIGGITATYDVQGTPEQEVMITWYFNGQEIELDLNPSPFTPPGANFFTTRQSVSVFDQDSNYVYVDTDLGTARRTTFYIPNVGTEHAGNYTVEVSSGDTRASATSFVFLGAPPVLIQTPTDIRDLDQLNETSLDFATSDGFDTCEKIFVYYATFQGDPKPEVACTDSRDDSGTQEEQPNDSTTDRSVKYSLGPFPPNLQIMVTCVGTNSIGSVSATRTITTFGTQPRLSTISPVIPSPCTQASDTPTVVENERACGEEGSGQITITHTLSADGSPAATIKWFHRNNNDVVREVSSGGRYSINRSGLRQRLQIQRPTSEDEGEYYITAQNCAGVIDSDDRGTFVNVYMAPMILIDPPLTPAIGSCQSNPGFDVISVRNVDSYEARLNVPVCLLCPNNGNPEPVLSWTRDNIVVQSSANFLDTTGQVFRGEQNCFACTATNFVGADVDEVCIQAAPNLRYVVVNQGCTKTCGRGVLDYVFQCIETGADNVEREVAESRCIEQQIPRPTIPPTTNCNSVSCPPNFLIGAWTPCSSSCEAGTRTRTVRCRQIDGEGISREVAVSVCVDFGLPELNNTEQCNTILRVRRTGNLNPCPVQDNFEWETSPWSACTQTCHLGRRRRTVRCREKPREPGQEGRVYPDETCIDLDLPKPPNMDICGSGPCNNYGIWLCGGWGQCTETCGTGFQFRDVVCWDPLTRAENDNCISYYRPEPIRRCSQGPCILTPECRDLPYLQCQYLLDSPIYCEDDRFKLACCKTCETVMFRTTTTPTTPTTTPTTPTTETTTTPANTTIGPQ